jgi:hypothetical protein
MREKLYKTFGALLDLRNNNEVFTSPQTSVDFWLSDVNGRKRIRLMHPSMNVTIVGNFGVTNQTIDPQFLYPGTWYDYFSGDSVSVGGGGLTLTLYPGQFFIFTDVKLPAPEQGLLVGLGDEVAENTPLTFELMQNYPNPFNPVTTISFSLPQSQKVELKIFNILGEVVATLVSDELSAGVYTYDWNAAANASGIYFYRLETDGFVQTKRMVLLK